jgi:hypothetical protein
MAGESTDPAATGLIVIARDTTGQIVTRICSHRDLIGAMNTAQSVLRLKLTAVRVEVHSWEPPTSPFQKRPLVTLDRKDLPMR